MTPKLNKIRIPIGIIFITVVGLLYWGKAATETSITVNYDEDYPVWIDMMEQPGIEMKEAREAFDKYWENHVHYKGDRSKQFEQWYAINSNRLDQYGNVISAAQVSSEFQKLRKQAGAAQEGEWFNYGPISVGPRNGVKKDGGRVKDIEFHPTDPNTFFVSTFKGGLFKTTDYGQNWLALTDGLTEEVFVCEVSDNNENIIFIGTDLGVYKSLDGGKNWNNTAVTIETNALLLKNGNQNIVIAGSEDGIRRSVDSGASWTLVKSASKVEDLDQHPTNPEIMYAATNGNPSEFFRSEDGGQTWTKNTTFGQGSFMGVAVSPAKPDYVYVINLRDHLGEDSFEGLYFSDDAGKTFTKQSGYSPCISGYKSDGAISRGQPNYNMFVCADPVNADVVYAGGVCSWKSADKGKTWINFYENITTDGTSLHLDQLNWAFSPHDNRIFAVNDGGVYYLNEENKFQMITDGLPIAEIYECTQSQTSKTNVAGGTMHCGVKLNYNGIWYTPWGGDEATCIIDPTDENYIYHLKYEKISRSIDGGFSFQNIYPNNTEKGFYTGTGTIHKGNPNTLFIGCYEVHRSQNAKGSSVNWQKISSFGGSSRIYKVEQCTANHDILYVSRESGFYRSDNANGTSPAFTNITLPTSGSVNDIETHPTNSNIVYILLGSKIYKSTNKGQSWTDLTQNLPSVALIEMCYDKNTDEGIYVGTDIGVFYKDAILTEWIDFSNNLPAIRVSGMDIYYGKDRKESFITISTDGRGFWRSLLHGITTEKPKADFSIEKTTFFTNEEIKITNKSSDVSVGSLVWKISGQTPSVRHEINPAISYSTPGNYTITQEVTNSGGADTKTINIVIEKVPAPVAKISTKNTTIFTGGIIAFNDNSDNLPTSWEWTFEAGEPASSTEQNPTITYNSAGSFDVTLKITNSTGSDTKTFTNFITVTENTGTGDLQAHYEFNGNSLDLSSYKRDMVTVGDFTPIYVTDHSGKTTAAIQLPAAADKYLTSGYKGIGGNGARTVTAWFKTPAGSPARKTIVSWGNNTSGAMFNIMVDTSDGTVRVEGGACSLRSTTSNLNDNKWHHVAITFDPNDGGRLFDAKIYIDGALDLNKRDGTGASYLSEVTVLNTNNTDNAIRIGAASYNTGYYWTGELDDIRIYSSSLSQSQISEISGIKTAIYSDGQINQTLFYSGKAMVRIDLKSFQNAEAAIFDIKGCYVRDINLHPGTNHIAIRPGIYLIHVKTDRRIEKGKAISF